MAANLISSAVRRLPIAARSCSGRVARVGASAVLCAPRSAAVAPPQRSRTLAATAAAPPPQRSRRCRHTPAAATGGNGATAPPASAEAAVAATSDNGTPAAPTSAEAAAAKYGWRFEAAAAAEEDASTSASSSAAAAPRRRPRGPPIEDVPIHLIRRPLGRTRANDQDKVAALMASISEIGLKEPIDVLLVDGEYYGFSGCHRFEAHQRLGLPTVRCRVRKASREILRMHMM